MLLCHLSSGMRPLYRFSSSSIASPLLFLIITPLWRHCFSPSQPIPSFVLLVVRVDHTYACTTHISFPFDPNSVPSLVTTPTTKATSASTCRVYISHDVIFDASVFPLSKLHPNVDAHLWLEISLLPDTLLPSSSRDSSMATYHMPKSTDTTMQ
jgi:hypothetical protein